MTADFPAKFGRYALTERLALGGMAELFLAEVTGAHGFAKTVVIKRILPHLAADQQFTAMFIAEAKITAKLDHPKIAQTFELGTEGGQLYIVMEFIDGLDVLALLRECAHRRLRVPPEIAVYIIKETLDALDFAHHQTDESGKPLGIVHRDVSPSNILLSRRGDVKLVDFGIAHAVASEAKTQAGTLKGKYGYMSPEQVLGHPVDGRSDLFSVGVVLAELLMGRRLFAAPNELDVLLMVRDVKLERLDRFGKNIDPALGEIVRWALRKDPSDRFRDAATFRDALDEWLFEKRHRITAKNVAEVVEALYDDAQGRRAAQVKEAPPPALGTPDASSNEVELRAAVAVGQSLPTEPPRRPPAPPKPAGPPPPDAVGSDAHAMEDLVIEETDVDEIDLALSPSGQQTSDDDDEAPTAVQLPPEDADDSIELGRPGSLGLDPPRSGPGDSIEILLDETFPTPPPDDDDEPVLSESTELDLPESYPSYPSITAAVAAAVPKERDPASRDFDDTDVSHAGPAPGPMRRMPTAEEIKESGPPRPPAPEEITETPARSGDLRQEAPLSVLWRMTAERATGLLVVSVGGTRKEIYYRRGVPEFVASNVAGELFGAYLVREGAITAAELDMALAVMPHFGGKLGDTLVGLGLMKPLEVFRHLTRQVRQKLVDVCTWSSGRYTWYPGRQNPRTSFPLDLDALEVYGAGAAAVPGDNIEQWLDEHSGVRPIAAQSPKVVPELFQLGSLTRRVHDALDGTRTLRQLADAVGDPGKRLETLRIVYLLLATQLAVDVG